MSREFEQCIRRGWSRWLDGCSQCASDKDEDDEHSGAHVEVLRAKLPLSSSWVGVNRFFQQIYMSEEDYACAIDGDRVAT